MRRTTARTTAGTTNDTTSREQLVVLRRIEVQVEVEVEAETERKRQVMTQVTTRLKILVPELPDEFQPVLREIQPRLRREVSVSRCQFPVRRAWDKVACGSGDSPEGDTSTACVGRASPKSEGRMTNQARRPNSRPAAWGLSLRASVDGDQKPGVITPREEGQGGKDRDKSKGEVEMTNDRTSSFVLGTMTPAASEPALSEVGGPALSEVEGPALSEVEGPALSEVEGTEARKRNIFAETTILYACTERREGASRSRERGQWGC